ncbi:hypothetical protein [Bacillus sp. OV322]|uniref:hypothetical protein n=1 Tax=Bacillus sp. OV322 TaxID=1882764 RepID=UPI00114D41FB|nr:hypothetical protein [Bacillus sp. OV322]
MNLIKKLKTSYQIKLSNNHRFLCHTMGSKTIVFDSSSWEKIAELSKPKDPGYTQFSQNDNYLYIKRTIGAFCVYDTEGFQLVKTLKSNKKYGFVEGDFVVTNTPFLILDTLKTKNGQQLALINIDKGEHRILTEFEDSTTTLINYNQYIKNANSYLFTLSYENHEGYRVNKIVKVKDPLNTGSIKVMENSEIWHWKSVIYCSSYNTYIVVDNYEVFILDGQFEEILKTVCLSEQDYPDHLGYFQHLHQSNDGRYIILTYSQTVLILRYDDLKPIVVEKIRYACFGEFSSDDLFLLIGTWENGYILENNLR